MIAHDDAFLDLVAVLALGALPATEARDVAAHLATCKICREEYTDLRATADAVGYGAELAPGALDELSSRRLKARVMTAVAAMVEADATTSYATAAPSTNGMPVGATIGTSPTNASAPNTARPSWLPYGAAVAAALVAAVSLANNASLRSARDADARRATQLRTAAIDRSQAQSRLATSQATDLEQRLAILDARVAKMVAPGSKHFPVAAGEVVASGDRVVIALRDLPKLPAGKVYQAWTLTTGAKAVAPSITFRPDAAGVAVIELPEHASHLAAVAVSVEPTGGSKAPTSKPAFVRALS